MCNNCVWRIFGRPPAVLKLRFLVFAIETGCEPSCHSFPLTMNYYFFKMRASKFEVYQQASILTFAFYIQNHFYNYTLQLRVPDIALVSAVHFSRCFQNFFPFRIYFQIQALDCDFLHKKVQARI